MDSKKSLSNNAIEYTKQVKKWVISKVKTMYLYLHMYVYHRRMYYVILLTCFALFFIKWIPCNVKETLRQLNNLTF